MAWTRRIDWRRSQLGGRARGDVRSRSGTSQGARLGLESLESRVLLSIAPESMHLLAHDMAIPVPIALSPSIVVIPREANPALGMPGELVEVAPTILNEPTPSMLVFVGPRLPDSAGELAELTSESSPATIDGQSSESSPFGTDIGADRSVGAIASAEAAAQGIQYAFPVLPGGSNASVPGQGGAGSDPGVSGVGVSTPQPALSSPSRAITSAPLSDPQLKVEDVEGSLDPAHDTASFTIPVGSINQSLGFSVHPVSGSSSDAEPVIGQVSLVDSGGNTLEQVGPLWGTNAGGMPQTMSVALSGAPAGGRLVVQITTANTSSSGDEGAASSSTTASATSVPFVLEIQRLNGGSSPDSSATGAPIEASIGSLTLGSSSYAAIQPDSMSTDATAVVSDDGSSATSAPAQAISSTDLITAASGDGAADGFNVRMPTGPLASRGAGPVAPTLALVDSDPAPPVDRHELALFQDLDEHSSDEGGGASAPGDPVFQASLDPTSAADETSEARSRPSNSPGRAAEPVIAIRSGGGFLSKVTGLGSGPRIDSAALLAALPAAAATDVDLKVAAAEVGPVAQMEPVASAALTSTDSQECPDFVKAAIGLALGLGLAAGPLFADFISAVPARLLGRRPKDASKEQKTS